MIFEYLFCGPGGVAPAMFVAAQRLKAGASGQNIDVHWALPVIVFVAILVVFVVIFGRNVRGKV